MAKRRLLKKDVGYIAGDMFTEVLFAKQYIPGVDPKEADMLLARILDMQDEYTRRAASPTGKYNKKLVKQYYRKFDEDFNKEIETISSDIDALSKKEQA